METIYLDNNATTRMLPEVVEAMMPYFTEWYGNPSSPHHQGTRPAAALREARERVAANLGCDAGEVVFTSCGTESDNAAIRGVLEGSDRRHAVATAVEHPAVLNPLRRMEALGCELTVVGVDAQGVPDLDALRDAIRDDTALVAAMWANNETGVLLPVREIVAIAHERGVPVLVDAVQAFGKVPVDLREVPADFVALSAHKFHGPRGVGALVVRRGTACNPFLLGGSQERGRRAGTENVPAAVGMAAACDAAAAHLDDMATRVAALRDRFERELVERVGDAYVHGANAPRLPNTSSICIRGVEGRAMLTLLDEVGICASAGSACKSGAGKPSAVLTAMGVSRDDAVGTLRFSLSALTTEAEIDRALELVPPIVERLRRRAARSS